MTLLEAAEAAVRHVDRWPADSTVRIVAHADPDGLAAGAVLARWLGRRKRSFHLTTTWRRDRAFFEELERDDDDPVLVADLGSDRLAELAGVAAHGLVVDHHAVPKAPGAIRAGGWVQLNPWSVGLDGSHDACAATTALAMAVADSDDNWDLAPAALAGAIGDRQDRPTFTGWNQEVHQEAAGRGVVGEVTCLAIDEAPLAQLVRWPAPAWLAALQDIDAASWLADLGLPETATPLDLDRASQQLLASALALRALSIGADAGAVRDLIARAPSDAATGMPLARWTSRLEAASRLGEAGLGLAWLLGDEKAAAELDTLATDFEAMVTRALESVAKQGRRRKAFHEATVEDVRLVSVVATRAIGRVVPDDRPLIVWAPSDGNRVVSARAAGRLVGEGLDLGRALSEAAEAAGGIGGGHAPAAGATVPEKAFKAFATALGKLLAAPARKVAP